MFCFFLRASLDFPSTSYISVSYASSLMIFVTNLCSVEISPRRLVSGSGPLYLASYLVILDFYIANRDLYDNIKRLGKKDAVSYFNFYHRPNRGREGKGNQIGNPLPPPQNTARILGWSVFFGCYFYDIYDRFCFRLPVGV